MTMDDKAVSVCMAAYNGSLYILDQIRSILSELHPQDEIVIVDDASVDGTAEIVAGIEDSRVRLVRQERNLGYVRTFEHALRVARGDVVFLADQDDLWVPGRRAALLGGLKSGGVAASNLSLLPDDAPLRSPVTGRPWMLRSSSSSAQKLKNELRILSGVAPYFGCAMAIDRESLGKVLPFPAYLTESHDLWIATVANEEGILHHVEDVTVRRRIHADNASTSRPRGIGAALRSRWLLVRLLFEARRRRLAAAALSSR